MKKLLALVLALVMTLGLATVGTSAAYSDANDIEYTEAADVMTAVGVFQGKGDAFAPKDNLNRAEAAKLVAYLMLGNKTAEAMKGTGAKFTDVPASHWASGYIEYLNTAGVVSGVGGGNFDPNGQVTAVAFAKMLLVALGYDAEIEGFTGNSSWAINIQKLANDNDLYDNLDLSSTAALTREQAAQMCLNDLKADMVEYEDKGTTVNVGGATVVTGAKKAKEVSSNNNNRYDGEYDGIKQLCEDLYGNDLKFTGTTDDLGRPANKWAYKNSDVGTYASSSDRLFTTNKKVTVKALYDVIGKDAYDNLVDGDDKLVVYLNGTKTEIAAGAANIQKYFYKDSSANAQDTGNGTLYEVYQEEDFDGNNNDRYTIVIAKTYLVQATADYSSSNESVKVSFVTDNGAVKPTKFPTLEIDNDDFPVADVKKDDYLLVTYSTQENDKFQTVAKATELEGEVTSYVAGDSVTVDGTKYSYSATIGANKTHGSGVEFDVGTNVKLILDGNGTVIYVDEADTSSSYVYIKSSGANTLRSKVEAEAYFTDGTTKTINVKKATYYDGTGAGRTTLKGNGVTSAVTMTENGTADYLAGQWYTYTVDSNGQYTLKVVGTGTSYKNTDNTQAIYPFTQDDKGGALDTPITEKEAVKFLYNGTIGSTTLRNIYADDDTILVVLDNDDDITVYTGVANIPGITMKAHATKLTDTADAARVSMVVDGTTAKYVFVDVNDVDTKTDDSTESNDYLFVLNAGSDKNYTTSSDYYYEYDLYRNNAEEEDVKIDEDAITGADALAAGSLYNKIKTSSKGYITGANKLANGDNTGGYDVVSSDGVAVTSGVAAIDYSSGTLSIGGTSYVLNTSEIVLVYGMKTDGTGKKADTAAIKENKNNSYELNVVNGSTLESNLDGYAYTYNYTALVKENTNKIEQLYVYIETTTATGTTSTPVATGDTPEVTVADGVVTIPVLVRVNPGSGTAKVTVNGNNLSQAVVKTAVNDALSDYTDVTFIPGGAGAWVYSATPGANVAQGTPGNEVSAKDGGVTKYFDVELDWYYAVEIDGDVKEWVLFDDDEHATITIGDIGTGDGTGYITQLSNAATISYGGAYNASSTTKLFTTDMNKAIRIDTGYVNVTGTAVGAGADYAKVGSDYVNAASKTTGEHYMVTVGTEKSIIDAAANKLTVPAATFGEEDFSIVKAISVSLDATTPIDVTALTSGELGSNSMNFAVTGISGTTANGYFDAENGVAYVTNTNCKVTVALSLTSASASVTADINGQISKTAGETITATPDAVSSAKLIVDFSDNATAVVSTYRTITITLGAVTTDTTLKLTLTP